MVWSDVEWSGVAWNNVLVKWNLVERGGVE